MGTRKCWIQAIFKINKTKQGKNKKLEIGEQIKGHLQELKELADKIGCNVNNTSVWVFTEGGEVKYMAQSFCGVESDICIRSSVEDNWPDAIISFYKNAKEVVDIQSRLNSDDYGF